ncbi:gas vesicle protein GvpO [Nonomuraea sp. NPDC050786]|uniref:gas vesicle protein GvpO n=1 Tax=Nonomuraea sp. NPDC050786 TaxID=3154840 RepID=UPI0033DE9A49
MIEKRSTTTRPREGGEAREPRRRELTAATAGEAGLQHIADLTTKQIEGVTAVEPVEGGWKVGVEVVEDRRIPSSGDILALYQTEMDTEGTLLSYRRLRRYRRSNADTGEAL